jgi:hypothetical protein
MVYTDPVVYDWAHIKVQALVIGGEKDGALKFLKSDVTAPTQNRQ